MSFQPVETIELVPDGAGSFVPDFNAAPATPAPIVPYTPPIQPPPPPPPPSPSGGSNARSWSPSDYADFGTDQYGHPNVVPGPNGNPIFNPETGFSPEELRRAEDALGNTPSTRSGRRRVGRAIGRAAQVVPVLDDLLTASQLGNDIGEAIGTPLGRALRPILRPNAPPLGAPSGNVNNNGPVEIEGGQCEDVRYVIRVVLSGVNPANGATYGPTPSSVEVEGPIYAVQPATPFFGNFSGGTSLGWVMEAKKIVTRLSSSSNRGAEIAGYPNVAGDGKESGFIGVLGGGGGLQDAVVSIDSMTIHRSDGQSDSCGDFRGAPVVTPVAPPITAPTQPTYPPEIGLPPGYRAPETGNPPGPSPDPHRPPDDRYPPGVELPDFGDLPTPDPAPDNNAPPNRPDVPTPEPDCCPSTERSLECIKQRLEDIFERLNGSGAGAFDVSPCTPVNSESGEASPTEIQYQGDGLLGIYSAISAIEKSLNTIHSNTKCPPETAAALPMFWEVKAGEVPQLNVLWKPVGGGNSRWAMAIPHPRADVQPDFQFTFPAYEKGPNLAVMKLVDNSQVRINVNSKSDAVLLLGYVHSLIDPSKRPSTVTFTYTENASTAQQRKVEACYLKKFAGHRNTAPLWAISL